MLGALGFVLFSVFGRGGYSSYFSLRESLESQRRRNSEAAEQVEELQRRVYGLEHDTRILERAARDELGMARPNEMIFTFEDKSR